MKGYTYIIQKHFYNTQMLQAINFNKQQGNYVTLENC